MKFAAFEAATEWCSVALWLDGEIVGIEEAAGNRHSERMLPLFEKLLKMKNIAARQLDAVAFGAGPGSFTGLRIACGVTQGLAFGAGLPVVGVCTLLALAEAVGAERAVCCIDARMGEVYYAAYAGNGENRVPVHVPGLYAPAEAPPLPAGSWTACGSGFAAHGAVLKRLYGDRLSAIMPDVYPHARDIARIAAREFEAGRAVSAEQAVPVYLRDKVADSAPRLHQRHERTT